MLNKKFFLRSPDIVAKELLGKIMQVNGKKAKIVETEAYFGPEDPASRARQNGDLKKTMEMDAGTILVYGVHNSWLINFVTEEFGKASAVLIRAVEPLNFNGNGNGPGILTKNLGIDKSFHKKQLIDDNGYLDLSEGEDEDFEIIRSHRIGVSEDLKELMRFYIKGNRHVSKK